MTNRRKWVLRALVVLGLWVIVVVVTGAANALMVPQQFKWGEYVVVSLVSTAVLIVVGSATLGAYELMKRIK